MGKQNSKLACSAFPVGKQNSKFVCSVCRDENRLATKQKSKFVSWTRCKTNSKIISLVSEHNWKHKTRDL